MVLDKALKILSNGKTTASCQTTGLINAYAVQNKDGITGQQIIAALTENGNLKDTICSDGSPSNMLEDVSKDLAKSCNLDSYLKPDKNKSPASLVTNINEGAILGYSKNGKTDSHFGYKDWKNTVDSMEIGRAHV